MPTKSIPLARWGSGHCHHRISNLFHPIATIHCTLQSADLLRRPPVQAASRADLRARLAVESGGVVFTTIQKFFPEAQGDRHPPLARNKPVSRLLNWVCSINCWILIIIIEMV